ncbi:hypothetical protein Cgig2_022276 [Carnegiea gigantea]|uniref:non-specific serine/threonine protein kinase n=1 Tax=Carnegiea gigantea TaxID=171969 RepID=A0A9Q1KG33_9CARY|nr:hypothetical protein Cgig2_022276 [Carnegiea gigantea]
MRDGPLASAPKGDGLLHTACGTPNYVAPEVFTIAADIWSCGVILFVLMAGYLPFDDSNLMTLYKKIQKADVSVPSWFSSGAKKLIKRILDPNPVTRMGGSLQRITISQMLLDEWFKKDYHPASFAEEEDVNLDDVDAAFNKSEVNLVTERQEKPVSMNAFELISGSQGFSLEGIFQEELVCCSLNSSCFALYRNLSGSAVGVVKRETRFTSQRPANEIISKIEEAAKSLDFNVHKQNYKVKLKGHTSGRKGYLSVATEVFEVAPSLHVVELRKTGGDTLEFHKAGSVPRETFNVSISVKLGPSYLGRFHEAVDKQFRTWLKLYSMDSGTAGPDGLRHAGSICRNPPSTLWSPTPRVSMQRCRVQEMDIHCR